MAFTGEEPTFTSTVLPDLGATSIDFPPAGYYKIINRAGALLLVDYTGLETSVISATITASTYTPTLTGVANVDASTAYQCQYMRVFNTVTVSGRLDIDPTTTLTSTQLGISLPVASNFGAIEDCGGVAFASGVSGQGGAILADTTNDRAQLQFICTDVTNQPMYFTFTYQVI